MVYCSMYDWTTTGGRFLARVHDVAAGLISLLLVQYQGGRQIDQVLKSIMHTKLSLSRQLQQSWQIYKSPGMSTWSERYLGHTHPEEFSWYFRDRHISCRTQNRRKPECQPLLPTTSSIVVEGRIRGVNNHGWMRKRLTKIWASHSARPNSFGPVELEGVDIRKTPGRKSPHVFFRRVGRNFGLAARA